MVKRIDAGGLSPGLTVGLVALLVTGAVVSIAGLRLGCRCNPLDLVAIDLQRSAQNTGSPDEDEP